MSAPIGVTLGARVGSILRAFGFGLLLMTAAPALAQTQIPPPEPFQPVDANGVNLQTGNFLVSSPTIAIGPKQGGLSYSAQYDTQAGAWRHGTAGGISAVQGPPPAPVYPYTTVTLMGQSMTFMKSPVTGLYQPVDDPSATLTLSGGILTLTLSDGSQAVYDQPNDLVRFFSNKGQTGKLTKPSGEILTFTYAVTTVVVGPETVTTSRIQSITNNFGYQLHFDYDPADWFRLAKVTALNNATDACAPSAVTCSYSRTWPSLTFGLVASTEQNVTDTLGQTTRLFFAGTGYHNLTGIRRPATSSGQDLTFGFMGTAPAPYRVQTITTAVGTWTYGYDDPPPDPVPNQYTLNTRVTEPALPGDTVPRIRTIGILSILDYYQHRVGRVGTVTDALGNTTTYGYDPDYKLLAGIEHPEHDKTRYYYDARGNIWKMERVAKSGSPVITTTAAYPANCASPITPATCNKPSSVTDARGAVTSFTYDATHGGVLTATSPAPTSGAVQPQTRSTYAPYTAWYKNAAGTITQDTRAIYLPTGTSACATLGPAVGGGAAPCAGLADEVKTTTAYLAGNASTASNLVPVSTTSGDGAGVLAATTTVDYNYLGDVRIVDGPLPGNQDSTRTYYDVGRQVIGVIGPDPDGSGALLYRASRTTYNANGQVTLAETGTATSQSDAGMSSFATLLQTATYYDSVGRKIVDYLLDAGGAAQTLTQYGYDAANRLTCQTVRMNPAAFSAAPVACLLGTTGSDGPDRITYTQYDAANRVTQVTSGYLSGSSRVEKTVTYTANGNEKTVADGKGNLTTYEYDDFDRLAKARYPNAACCASSTTDFDAYDANDNRTTWQHRPQSPGLTGQTVTYAYDALNRMTYHDAVSTWVYYDNLARPTYTYAGASAEKIIAHYYDGLGRPSYTYDYRDGTWFPTYTGYDLAGRRTTLQWSDGFYVTYGYDNTNAMIATWQNGTTLMAGYVYDDLGRRKYSWFGAGGPLAVQAYNYDAASRLSQIVLDLQGSAQDQTWNYAYNAASQLKTRTSYNAAYNWTPGPAITRGYTINGLNQAVTAGAATIAYDGRGNLTSDGATAFGYDLDNHLLSASGASSATLSYDPLGRLGQTTAAATTRFVYSGSDLIAELNTSNAIVRRYVPGPGTDEPRIWYEGSGTSDARGLIPDERGSIVAVTNASGAATTINTYDEYGVPAAGNVGRFQYTGQTWLPEVGLYNYKARIYSPTLGRFLQTDPTGYDDGLNWYAYVGNDPLNGSDPTGTQVMPQGFYPAPATLPSPQSSKGFAQNIANHPGQSMEATGSAIQFVGIASAQPEVVVTGRGVSTVGRGGKECFG